MSARLRHLLLIAGAAVLLAGCGSDDEEPGPGIPADDVAAIDERLDEIQRRFDAQNAGACEDIDDDSFKAIQATISGLPSDTDPEIQKTLEEGLGRLQELTTEGCADVKPAETETETVPEETIPEETVPEETVTETVPPETQPETTPERTTPGQGQGGGQGQGQGQGGEGGAQAPEEGD